MLYQNKKIYLPNQLNWKILILIYLLKNIISSIPSHFEIIVIENSLQNETKNDLEKNFSNVKVLIPNENLGYSGGINLGVENSKYNFVLALVADVVFSIEMLQNFEVQFLELILPSLVLVRLLMRCSVGVMLQVLAQ